MSVIVPQNILVLIAALSKVICILILIKIIIIIKLIVIT